MAAFEGNGCIPEQTEFQRGYQAGLNMNEHYLKKYVKLKKRNAELVECLEQIDSMAMSPEWRNEPLWRIAEMTESVLGESNE